MRVGTGGYVLLATTGRVLLAGYYYTAGYYPALSAVICRCLYPFTRVLPLFVPVYPCFAAFCLCPCTRERTFQPLGFQGHLTLETARLKVTVLRTNETNYGQVTDRLLAGYTGRAPKNSRKACPAVTITPSVNKV